jgi:hypothetical protein
LVPPRSMPMRWRPGVVWSMAIVVEEWSRPRAFTRR